MPYPPEHLPARPKGFYVVIYVCFCTLLLMTQLAPLHAQPAPLPTQIIAYVFPNLPGDRPLTAMDVDPTKVTRINYAFALIHDGKMIEGSPHDAVNLAVLTSLKARNPALEVLVSVGGWTGSGGFSDAALTPASRARFIESAVAFLSRYHLDGLDVDWEYPGLPGAGNPNRPEDRANFTALLRELRARFDALSPHKHLLLTIAAGASSLYRKNTDLATAQVYLDQVNLMAYDFNEAGPSPSPTGNHAALFADPADPSQASADAEIRAFEQAGVPAAKLILGVPFYGHLWGNVPNVNHGLFQPGVVVTQPAPPDLANNLDANGFTRFWDAASQVPYAYNETTQQFFSFEDPESLRAKCAYIRQQHLGGVMFWQYFADPSGTLLRTLNTELRPESKPHP